MESPTKIDLDALLHGPRPEWDDVVDFFKNGEFDDEHYLVAAIKKYLMSNEILLAIHTLGLSIEDCLNGRYSAKQGHGVQIIFDEWNKILGFVHFGG